ncbi:MAG: energy transducer TonB [Desulfobacter sp.]|nr:MAG: energy transducer TonB [Desulfobacter sp.]
MKETQAIARLNPGWSAWMAAAAATLALNLALFSVIPNLMAPEEATPTLGPMIPQIQLTRVRRTEPDPVKEKVRPQEKKPEEKRVAKPKIGRPAARPLTLPFEINTRLPGGPGTLVLPQVMSGALTNLNLDTLFSPGDLDQPLTPLSRIPPVYPFKAKRQGIEGWVSVEFTVTEQGRVADIKILSAKPEKIFDASVIQCLTAWRFKPGRVGGEPVKTRVKTRIRFELN